MLKPEDLVFWGDLQGVRLVKIWGVGLVGYGVRLLKQGVR